ncbi:sigma factor-like helix-turn-helix DNA-binding protein [Flavitalea flava]
MANCGLSHKEVSERLGISPAMIKRHMNEALKFLHADDTWNN